MEIICALWGNDVAKANDEANANDEASPMKGICRKAIIISENIILPKVIIIPLGFAFFTKISNGLDWKSHVNLLKI